MTTPNPQGYPGQDPNAPGQPGVPPQPGPPPGYGPPGAPPPGYPPPPPGYPPPQGGYPPPQQGGYPPPQGYGAPAGYGAPPPGYASADDKTWALVAHFGGAAGSFISLGALAFVGPLISYLGRGTQSETVKTHAKAALNFFAPLSAVAVVLWVARVCLGFVTLGFFLGFLLWLVQLAVAVVGIAFGVIAGMRANEGQLYKYPLNFNFIK